MGLVTGILAYLAMAAALSGVAFAAFMYLVTPPDPARMGSLKPAPPRAASTLTPHVPRPQPAKETAPVAKTPPAASRRITVPDDRTGRQTTGSQTGRNQTVGLGSAVAEPSAPPPPVKKPKKRTASKKPPTRPQAVKRQPPANDLWTDRYAGPAYERPYYGGPGPYWYR